MPGMPFRRVVLWIALAAVLPCLPGPASAQELSIAAASDLQTVLPAIAERFQRETGVRAGLTFGSSGTFFSQIQNLSLIHISEPTRQAEISYAVFCLKKKKQKNKR